MIREIKTAAVAAACCTVAGAGLVGCESDSLADGGPFSPARRRPRQPDHGHHEDQGRRHVGATRQLAGAGVTDPIKVLVVTTAP
ncbi:hypothetical protein [Spirillospora sp. NPDC047279]|uniref:hypothetical protein n=1 Tax=Spirillospora sp. NPDC047279 TaxID=3155478 RepID=UPI003400D2A9